MPLHRRDPLIGILQRLHRAVIRHGGHQQPRRHPVHSLMVAGSDLDLDGACVTRRCVTAAASPEPARPSRGFRLSGGGLHLATLDPGVIVTSCQTQGLLAAAGIWRCGTYPASCPGPASRHTGHRAAGARGRYPAPACRHRAAPRHRDVQPVLLRVDVIERGPRLLAVEARVDVAAAGKNDAVKRLGRVRRLSPSDGPPSAVPLRVRRSLFHPPATRG